MPNLDPTNEEFAQLKSAADAKGVRASVVGTDLLDRYKAGDFSLANVAEFLDSMKQKRAHWFIGAEVADEEQEAFGNGNATAASKLFRKLGASEYAARAAAWGLGPNDFGKRGTPPADQSATRDITKKPGSENPFSAAGWNLTKQGALVRSNPALAASLARSAGVAIGALRPRAA